jgi:hypothetical protein
METLLLFKTDSTGHVLSSLALSVTEIALVVKMSFHSIGFSYRHCLPCDFKLTDVITSDAKANFQSHSCLMTVIERDLPHFPFPRRQQPVSGLCSKLQSNLARCQWLMPVATEIRRILVQG